MAIAKIKDEEDDSYTDEDLFNISSWGADLSFRELITMYAEDELLKPELQRQYVWDKPEASRFIDSLLLGLPVPSIFLANTGDDRKLIIDGYQRIMTVFDFVRGIWSKDGRTFKLSNTDKIHKRWGGKAFNELRDDEQRRIRATTIHAIIFEQHHPTEGDSSLYQIFERINTSGKTLMPQEIRNCVYQGPINDLLFELNDYSNWRELFGTQMHDPRMRDMEFILRFMALNREEIWGRDCNQRISLKKFLNDFMGDKSNHTRVGELREDFTSAIDFIAKYIGKDAFFNVQQKDPSKIRERFYPTIYDSIIVATSMAQKRLRGDLPMADLEEKRLDMIRSDVFKDYISEATMKVEHIQGRISLALERLYGIKI